MILWSFRIWNRTQIREFTHLVDIEEHNKLRAILGGSPTPILITNKSRRWPLRKCPELLDRMLSNKGPCHLRAGDKTTRTSKMATWTCKQSSRSKISNSWVLARWFQPRTQRSNNRKSRVRNHCFSLTKTMSICTKSSPNNKYRMVRELLQLRKMFRP